MSEFEEIVAANYRQREMDELERAARVIERGNQRLAELPPEGEWLV